MFFSSYKLLVVLSSFKGWIDWLPGISSIDSKIALTDWQYVTEIPEAHYQEVLRAILLKSYRMFMIHEKEKCIVLCL